MKIAAGLSLGSPNDGKRLAGFVVMTTNANPPDNRTDHLPVDELGPNDARRVHPPSSEGVSPQRPETMPRAEDDEETFSRSPEFHDQQPKGSNS